MKQRAGSTQAAEHQRDLLRGVHCLAAADELQPLSPAAVLVLFSGGVDSTLLAALAHQHLPLGQPIDLASVCFAGGASPDRLAALDALQVTTCCQPPCAAASVTG